MRISIVPHHLLMVFFGLFLGSCTQYPYSSSSFNLLNVDETIQRDSSYVELIAPYKKHLDAQMQIIVAEAARPLIKGRGESILGNLVADMQLSYSTEKFDQPIDISVINNGGLRSNLPMGKITVGNIYELSPFENFIYLVELSANDVKKLALYSVKGKNLGIAGMQVESREGELVAFTVGGIEVVEGRTYTLAINDYLANGGDNMAFLIDLPRMVKSNVLLREMLIDQMKKWSAEGKLINAEIEGRQILN